MLAVLARQTLLKTKNKKILISWFSSTPYTVTQQNRSNKTHRLPAPTIPPQALLAIYKLVVG
jgi:hypothetical protein